MESGIWNPETESRKWKQKRVGHMLSIFGDNYVMWSEAEYYYSKGNV